MRRPSGSARLTADLDNPFNHGSHHSLENVSLEPFQLAVQQMAPSRRGGPAGRGATSTASGA